jgi:hypothetical protein
VVAGGQMRRIERKTINAKMLKDPCLINIPFLFLLAKKAWFAGNP